jgi:3-dehydroquinate synthase
MKTVYVELGTRSYPVLIGQDLLGRDDVLRTHIGSGRVLVVTNTTVGPLFLERTLAALPADKTSSLVLPDGEVHKTVATWSRIVDELVRIRATRDACIVSLGGGVIGDMAGFAAASYMRGIDFVQVPTTLLAQVDASVGGKTGVNHREGKNLIGAFHQPRAVIVDIATMATLPDREYRAGVAEVVKYGLIRDPSFFDWLESHIEAVNQRAPGAVQTMVEVSVRNKAEVVAADEREAGSRALLNLGHSFGHAIETLTGYEQFLHGEAVAIGMVVAARLSEIRGILAEGAVTRLRSLLSRLGLPVQVPGSLSESAIFSRLALDKKTLDGQLRLILLDGIGAARVDTGSSESQILEAIEDCRA